MAPCESNAKEVSFALIWKLLFILRVKVLLDYKFLDYFEVNRKLMPRSG